MIHLEDRLNVADFNLSVNKSYMETVQQAIAVAKSILCMCDSYDDMSQSMVFNMHINHEIHVTCQTAR